MSKTEHLAKLRKGVESWNRWREKNTRVVPYLRNANLRNADLGGAELFEATLSGAELRRGELVGADLSGANLSGADLSIAMLVDTNLEGTDLTSCSVHGISGVACKTERSNPIEPGDHAPGPIGDSGR